MVTGVDGTPGGTCGRPQAAHRFDAGSLLAAALFAAVATIGLLSRTVSIGREVRWMWPVLFLGTGAALLVSAATRARESSAARPATRTASLPFSAPTGDEHSQDGHLTAEPLWDSAGEQGTGDEVGAERGEDGEVQQPGGGHHG